jgi:cobalt-zinc-cadmium efflux system membrane fusion protein
MRILLKISAVILFIFSAFLYSCSEKAAAAEDKQGYILPDSLLKTIEIDTVSSSRLLNSLTLTGKVDFNEDQVIKIYPAISGQISDIKVMLGDYVKKGQPLAVIKSMEMAGFSYDYTLAKSNLALAK